MRRKDRQITERDEIGAVIAQCKVCRVGMVDGEGRPYVVPLNFGVEQGEDGFILYFHTAPAGRKVGILRASPYVCVEMDCGHRLVRGETPCRHGFNYASVIGEGRAEFLATREDKEHGLNMIMRHQTGESGFLFGPAGIDSVEVIRVALSAVTAKRCRPRGNGAE